MPKGRLDLEWCRAYFSVHEEVQELRYGIRLVKNKKFTDLWAPTLEELDEWKKHLGKYTVLTDFHQKFTPVKMIGRGSFARVYLVEDNKTKEKFAVKAFCKEHLAQQKTGRVSLMNEIKILHRLRHQNVMKLEEVHESQNSVYLVQEFMEGGELFNYVSNHQTLTAQELVKILSDLLKAVDYLDKNGIMHRDLKPENIILKFRNSRPALRSFSREESA